ncbi:MAG: tetratricopeptide repeat protein, partial [Chloroflexota bacterium]
EAAEACAEALDLAGDLDDQQLVLDARKQLGNCFGQQGKFAESIQEMERALRLAEGNGNRQDAAYINYSLGVSLAKTGDLARAAVCYERAARHWEVAESPIHLGQALVSEGMLHYYQGEYDTALARFEEALAKAQASGHLRSEAYALASIADVHRDCGRYAEAMERYEAALRIADRVLDAFLSVYTLNAIGNAYRLLGDQARAERTIRRALLQAEERGSAYEIGLCEISLAAVHNELEEHTRAVRYLKNAQRLLGKAGARREVALAHLHLAQAKFISDKPREVKRHLTAAISLAAELGYDEFIVVEGRRLHQLFQWAVENNVGGKRLATIVQRLNAEQRAAPVLTVVPPIGPVPPMVVPAVRVRALGKTEVICDGAVVGRPQWKTDKAREMLYYFLSNPGWLRRDNVICALWPDYDPAKAESSFHTTLYRLRHALFPEIILQREGRYRCNPAAGVWYDVTEFEGELTRAKTLPEASAERREALRKAVDLYQGSFLEEAYAEWAENKRKRIEQRYYSALDSLAHALMSAGQLREGLAFYELLLSYDTYREDVQREVLRGYALLGDLAGAARRYQQYVDFLARELGVRPSARTQALYDRIVRGEALSPEGA